ncbi:TetR/AcrR family transcriptional regulator [Leptotrichia buccalis]|uniref:Transcriptional regulator, TetR family n=1 Tax=Leptotrichia buccalis (strain ATCC 14201 / DSM 1135 / JCM 12969 / NCTC 10249 / C-1013-b) TaxID=523794 RepID=C7NE34_LEPBD|nr:TetR/AcrR family transcriptional regulator [Leptotrichia buccalis]ACV38229.1 transcriptional regulator, TetR family [Leptotrichia buccalis C-1013-b]
MERKKGKKNQKRKKILDKAWELFRKNGYEETKVEDITRELGVSKGSFYTYFKTKDEVLYEILERIKKENEERISKINVNQEPSKILEDYVISKMNYIVKLLNNMKISSINRNLSNSKLKNFFEELKKVSIEFIKKNIVEKFNKINGNKYNLEIISEFVYLAIEEFLYNEFVLKNFKNLESSDFINIENTDEFENSLKEVIKFINNAFK